MSHLLEDEDFSFGHYLHLTPEAHGLTEAARDIVISWNNRSEETLRSCDGYMGGCCRSDLKFA